MKTLIIYTSQTGFTKRYALWLAGKVDGDVLELKDAQKKENDFFDGYDAICYGGWAMAEKIVKSKWFLEKAESWKNKKLAMFCVGGTPNGEPQVDALLKNALTDAQSEYIKVFYCQGGMNYEKMSAPTRITMKMFVSAVKNKKDATSEQKEMFERMASSYDISDIKYIEPIAAYLTEINEEKAV
ncbi:flavodoxin domain-containing protein [Butyrivibrio hungatei]|uniref:Flavodoxin n=1 Tax=Butyrivibrio hungatei TaxID=185008 RepID=A0A1D9P2C5_9FIRM|nr:flavodoxin domain-containing protein [Butyrivibrio hungatei]AOZ96758.1 flavodoxin [Butyrivibrio hungatei]